MRLRGMQGLDVAAVAFSLGSRIRQSKIVRLRCKDPFLRPVQQLGAGWPNPSGREAEDVVRDRLWKRRTLAHDDKAAQSVWVSGPLVCCMSSGAGGACGPDAVENQRRRAAIPPEGQSIPFDLLRLMPRSQEGQRVALLLRKRLLASRR